MRTYELMVLLVPTFEHDQAKQREEMINYMLLKANATVVDIVDLGKKQLAYPIRKHKEAVYLLAHIQSEALKIGAIENQVKLNEKVLRYLLTVKKETNK